MYLWVSCYPTRTIRKTHKCRSSTYHYWALDAIMGFSAKCHACRNGRRSVYFLWNLFVFFICFIFIRFCLLSSFDPSGVYALGAGVSGFVRHLSNGCHIIEVQTIADFSMRLKIISKLKIKCIFFYLVLSICWFNIFTVD